MSLKLRNGREAPEQILVIITKSGDNVFGSVGTVGGIDTRPGEHIEYRSIEQPVQRALELAVQKSNGLDVVIDLDDDVTWKPEWGTLAD